MANSDRDPIQKPGLTPESRATRRNSGRFVAALIGTVALIAFCLYIGIVIWGATGSQ